MVEFRGRMQLEKDNLINSVVEGYNQITAGSKCEGIRITTRFTKIIIILYVDKYRVCVFQGQTKN